MTSLDQKSYELKKVTIAEMGTPKGKRVQFGSPVTPVTPITMTQSSVLKILTLLELKRFAILDPEAVQCQANSEPIVPESGRKE